MANEGLSSPAYAQRLINRENEAEREKKAEISAEDYKFFCADIRNGLPEVSDNSIDAIICDAPYERSYIKLYSDLSRLAARVLKEGSPLVVMTGQSHLPEVINRLSENMKYNWCLCYQTTSSGSILLHNRCVMPYWKPILWFSKGKPKFNNYIHDTIIAPPSNKSFEKLHPHEQSVEGFMEIIKRFTVPGDLIFDCFCGAGTTGVAAVKTGRKFIGSDISKNILQ